jgi:hypothetical protein
MFFISAGLEERTITLSAIDIASAISWMQNNIALVSIRALLIVM